MDYRSIVRCRHCQLRQYETHDLNCRKCHRPLYWEATVQSLQPEAAAPMPEPQPMWGKMLQRIRHERGLSQKQLGAKSGMVRTFVSKLERRDGPPSMATALRLAGALDIPNYVLTNNDIAYEYYCSRLLIADPLIEVITKLWDRLSREQRVIILDTVRSLAQHHQMSFSEWERIPLAALGSGQCKGLPTG